MDLAALRAYASIAQQTGNINQAATGDKDQAMADIAAAEFSGLVSGSVDNVRQAVQNAEDLTFKTAQGEAELVDVVTAMAAAEVQLESVIGVRDQVIRAYKEILQMPI